MIEMYQKAGKIVKEVREMAVNEVHEGMKVLTLVNLIESEIKKRGGLPAFPCNISINEVTAHYTSPSGDKSILKEGDLVKIDLGAHVEGYIADSATSVMIGSGEGPFRSGDKTYTPEKQAQMIETANNALEVAISNVRPGCQLGKIGTAVEEYINSRGLFQLQI
jgi:methionyl aminopeptidase